MPIDLSKITKGTIAHAPRVLIYGGDGVGKTRFAANAPEPFLIDANKGSLAYDVRRVMPETWAEVREWVQAVEDGKVKCKTLVLDAMGDLEMLSHAEFFVGTSIDAYGGGYGHGETLAITKWREFLGQLERVWAKNIGIVMVAHMIVRKFDDPTGPAFDRFEVSLRKQLASLLRQWAEHVLFAREEIAIQQTKGATAKAVTTNARWIYTRRTPAYDAKSRGTALFPERVPLSWQAFAEAVERDEERVKAAHVKLAASLRRLGDPNLAERVREFVRTQPEKILEALARVEALVAKKEERAAETSPSPKNEKTESTQPAATPPAE